ncbi:uncharacterized protein P174DRAFT_454842 [Aspergillus novofumigatus IBT 16806]|uniref:MFS general substrate transporter n=1 Tax=Aspergillus novofumigatus (strain IBT 16806) TaxID=1392255 RepID=A0A2I1BWT6_ASPN1|nr:uncharacterized protein P174DRAFT_454842 [Aspergillus novofumigatus IBT 16806]PKX89854.1 hypothetical protein P174DRAFT_454842 [Aspergillus novofumigatus IBT 16806]
MSAEFTPASEQPGHTYDHEKADELARAVKEFEESDQPNLSHREHASQSSPGTSFNETSKGNPPWQARTHRGRLLRQARLLLSLVQEMDPYCHLRCANVHELQHGRLRHCGPGTSGGEFGISAQAARVGQMIVLVTYAFGCELWAPWSEEFGRWPIMPAELFLVNVWQIPCAVAPNFGTIVVCRALGELSSAGGSVTLGMTADMWEAEDQCHSLVRRCFDHRPFLWRAHRAISILALGVLGAVDLRRRHADPAFIPSSRKRAPRSSSTARACRRRTAGDDVYGPNELKTPRLDVKDVMRVWHRPFERLLREPIVLCLSLLSGFSDALIFIFTESLGLVFEQWGFSTLAVGMIFGSILIGYVIAYVIFLPDIWCQRKIRKMHGPAARLPERRLLLLLFIAPLEPIGLLGFAWTSMEPAYTPWIAPCIFACPDRHGQLRYLHGNHRLHGCRVRAVLRLSDWWERLRAGTATMYATPMYENIGSKFHLQWARILLGCTGVPVLIPLYIFYWKGPTIRERSKFAQMLEADRQRHMSRRVSYLSGKQKPYDV